MPITKKSGFTLIELLITISIIAILSAIGMVAYSSVMKQGRDSKRQSDIRSIQSAMEMYYVDQGFYPVLRTDNTCPNGGKFKFSSGGSFCDLHGVAPLAARIYMKNVPNDPQETSQPYIYTELPTGCDNSTTKCSSYCLYAKLENPPSPLPSPPTGCAYPTDYTFAVSPP